MNTDGKVWNKDLSEANKSIKAIPTDFKIGNIKTSEMFRKNGATLLAVSYSSFSDPVIASFLSESPTNLPKLIVRPILNPLKWIIWSKLLDSKEDSYTIRGDLPGAIDVFGMENKYAAYVFLIDSFGSIRWKAAGMATPQEINELKNTFKLLTKT